ncbi:TetR/AcrR family transcriptional regulator [Sandaracinobacter neustonicus]|uniref:TetR/AcrR family transcriptional regulator n=1 Tax=Sandaracinobacter neustonicus TaxID=1715348 RepID=A0A501XM83_9SPHN|nr:TetR/AcrR family transcriptional regulator [Sandaracinobacter neustonicus]TPE61374.1 TetR/AcrR family transcriptional regulator [Sandaracinobacter neustonicus]
MGKAARQQQDEAAQAVPRDVTSFIRYADYLAHLIETAPKQTKGERTRDKLKFGAIQVLDEVGYHAMRVSDICDAAGVAAATFYLYFDNKEQVTSVVLGECLEASMKMMATRHSGKSAFEAIRASNMKWVQVTAANAGLMRCILQLGDEVEEFRNLSNAANKKWYERIAQSILREHGTALPHDVALLSAYALGSMMDELARKLLIHPDPALVDLQLRVAPSHEDLADYLSVLWHQALYGRIPADIDLRPAAAAATALVGRDPG